MAEAEPLSQAELVRLINSSILSDKPLCLAGATLRGASLYEANLSGADLCGACYNANTLWPEGFDPEAAGAVLVDD